MGDKAVLQAVLMLLLTCGATNVHSAPFSADDFLQQKQTDLSTLFHSSKGGMIGPLFKQDMPHNWDSPDGGCFYQFQHYEEGDRIITNEPCLNCTCHNSMLMCYLKVCPFSKPIGQDCTIEKRPDQCCPVITCPQVPVNLQVMQMMTSTTTPEPEMSPAAMATSTEHGCTVEGRYYPDGAQVPGVPNKPCELCYCIRNHTACVMQECILKVNGCDPVFEDNICCPVRYKCAYDEIEGFTTTTEGEPIGNGSAIQPATTTMIPGPIGCMHKGEFYADGASIPTEDPCEHCYCMKSDLVCAIQECRSPLDEMSENCTPRTPAPGQCCPEAYDCRDGSVYTLPPVPPAGDTPPISGTRDQRKEPDSPIGAERPEATPATDGNTTLAGTSTTDSSTEVYVVVTTEGDLLSFPTSVSEDGPIYTTKFEETTVSSISGETTIKPFGTESETSKPTESTDQTYQSTGISTVTEVSTDDDQVKSSTKIYEETEYTVSTETSTGTTSSQIIPMVPESPNDTSIHGDEDFSPTDTPTSEKPIHIGSTTPRPFNDTTFKVPDESSTEDYSPESGVETSSTLETSTDIAPVTEKIGDNDKITDALTTRPGEEFTSKSPINEGTSTDTPTSEKPIHIGSTTPSPFNDTTFKVPDESSTEDYSPESGVETSSTLETSTDIAPVTEKIGDNDKITDALTTRPGEEFTSKSPINEGTSTDIPTEIGASTENLETGETQADQTSTTKIPAGDDFVAETTGYVTEKSPGSAEPAGITGSDNETFDGTITNVPDQNEITTENPAQVNTFTNMPVKPTDLPDGNETYTDYPVDYEEELSSTVKDVTEITTIKTTVETGLTDEEANDELTGPVTNGTMSTDVTTESDILLLTTEIYDDNTPSDISTDSATSIVKPIDAAISSEKPTAESATDIPTSESKTTSKPTQEIQSEKPSEVETSSVTITDATTDKIITVETTSEEEPTTMESILDSTKFPTVTETTVAESETTIYNTETSEPYTFSPEEEIISTIKPTEGYVTTVPSIEGESAESISTCFVNGYEYGDGSSIPVSSQCQESCLCYNGNVSCKLLVCPPAPPAFLRCASSIPDGECCPSYTCPPVETNTTESSGCIHEYEQYSEGEYVPSHDLCTDCYCLNGDVICANLECPTPSEQNCQPIERPPGSCCPTKYQCDSVMPEIGDQIKTNYTDEQVTPITTSTVSTSESTESPDILMTGPDSVMETRTTAPDNAKMTTPMLTTTENYEEISSTSLPIEVEDSSETVSVSTALPGETSETSESGDTDFVTTTKSTDISIEGISSTVVPSETGSHGNGTELGYPTVIPATESHSDEEGDTTSHEKPGTDNGNATIIYPGDKPSSSTPDDGVTTSRPDSSVTFHDIEPSHVTPNDITNTSKLSSEDGYKTTIFATTEISEGNTNTLTSTPSYGEPGSNTVANTKPPTDDYDTTVTTSLIETDNDIFTNQNVTDLGTPDIDSEYQTTLLDTISTEGTPTISDDGDKFDSDPDYESDGNTIDGTESSVTTTSTPEDEIEYFGTELPPLVVTSNKTVTSTVKPPGIPGEGSCMVNNTTYENGEDIPTQTLCQESCTCHNSIITCTLKPCPSPPPVVFRCEAVENPEQCCPTYNCPTLTPNNTETSNCFENGNIFTHGEFVPSQDICTDCYCLNGEVVCATLECPKPEGKNCKTISIREGSCCPEIYDCDESEDSTTPQPDGYIISETTSEAFGTTEGTGATTIDGLPTDPTKVDISAHPDENSSTTEAVTVSDGISNTDYDTTTTTPWYVTLSSTEVDEATSLDTTIDDGSVVTNYQPDGDEVSTATPFTSLDHQQTTTSPVSEFTGSTESTSPSVSEESSTVYPSGTDYPSGVTTDYSQSTMITSTDKTLESDTVSTIYPTDGSQPSQHPILFPTTPGSTTVTHAYEETGTTDIISTVEGSGEAEFYSTTATYLPDENVTTEITVTVEGLGEGIVISTTNETIATDTPGNSEGSSEAGFSSSTVVYLPEETTSVETDDPLTEKTTPRLNYTDIATTEYPEAETPPVGDMISTRHPSGYGSSTEYSDDTLTSIETTTLYPLIDDESDDFDNQTAENEVSVIIPSTTESIVDITTTTEISNISDLDSEDPLYETTPYKDVIYTTSQVGGDITTDEMISMDSLPTLDQGDSITTYIPSDYPTTNSPALTSTQKTATAISGHFTTLFPEIPSSYETSTLVSETVPISLDGSNTEHQDSITTDSSPLITFSQETEVTTISPVFDQESTLNDFDIPTSTELATALPSHTLSTEFPLDPNTSIPHTSDIFSGTGENSSVSEVTKGPNDLTEEKYTPKPTDFTSEISGESTETEIPTTSVPNEYHNVTSEDPSLSENNEDIIGHAGDRYTPETNDYTSEPTVGVTVTSTVLLAETETPSTKYPEYTSVTIGYPGGSEDTESTIDFTGDKYTPEQTDYTSEHSSGITEASTVFPLETETQSMKDPVVTSVTSEDPPVSEGTEGNNNVTEGKYTPGSIDHTSKPSTGITETSTEFQDGTDTTSTTYPDDESVPSFTSEDPNISGGDGEGTDNPTGDKYTPEPTDYTPYPTVGITETETPSTMDADNASVTGDPSVSGVDDEGSDVLTDDKYTPTPTDYTSKPFGGITEISTMFTVETETQSAMIPGDIYMTSEAPGISGDTEETNDITGESYTPKPTDYTSEPSEGITETSTLFPEETEAPSTRYPDLSVQTTDTSEKPIVVESSGCLIGEIFYENESNVPSSSLCQENCKCSNGMVLCQKPSCPAPPGFLRCSTIPSTDECCPTYNCTQPTDSTETQLPICTSDGEIYTDGEYVPSMNECTDCYCLGGEIICAQLQCVSPGDNCQPISQSNTSCCPDRYECVETTDSFESTVAPEVTPEVIETTSVAGTETSDYGDSILSTSSPSFSNITVTGRPLDTEITSSTLTSDQGTITITEASAATDGLESTLSTKHQGTVTITEASVATDGFETSEHVGTITFTEASAATDGLNTTWSPFVTVETTDSIESTVVPEVTPEVIETTSVAGTETSDYGDSILSTSSPSFSNITVTGRPLVTEISSTLTTDQGTITITEASAATDGLESTLSTKHQGTVTITEASVATDGFETSEHVGTVTITEASVATDGFETSEHVGTITITEASAATDGLNTTWSPIVTVTEETHDPQNIAFPPGSSNISQISENDPDDIDPTDKPGITDSSIVSGVVTEVPTGDTSNGTIHFSSVSPFPIDSTSLPSTETDLTVSVYSTESTLAIDDTEITGADTIITEGRPVTEVIPSSTDKYPGEPINDFDKVTGDSQITMTTSSDSLITESSGHNITGMSSTASNTSSEKYPVETESTDKVTGDSQITMTTSSDSLITESSGHNITGMSSTASNTSSEKYPVETESTDKVTGDSQITMTTSSDSLITESSGHNITGMSSTASNTSSEKYPVETDSTDNIDTVVEDGVVTTAGYPIVFPDPSLSTPQISVSSSTDLPTSSFSNSIPGYSTHATEPPTPFSSTETDDYSVSKTSTKPFPPYPGLTSPTYPTPSASSSNPESTTEFALGPGACLFDGKVYVSAQQIPRDDPCDFCFCFRGDIICLQQSCPPPIPGCYEEPIAGFCCPRYECPVSQTVVDVTTTTTPIPYYPPITSTKNVTMCEIADRHYNIGELVEEASGPCLECRCGEKGMMACDPKDCEAQQVLRNILRTKYKR